MILIDTQKEEFSKLRDIRVFGRISHDDRFNGNLLVIGLGGVGSRTVCNLKGMMVDDIIPEDNIHFLMIDSDIPEMEQTIEDSKEHVGFNALEVLSIYRPNIENILADGIKKNPVHPNLANWMDADFPDVTVTKDGAHGNRQIGRLMFSNAYEDIRMLLFDRLEEIHDKANGNWMDVIIVSSLSGGTGSGILSDLTYNIRAYGKAKKWANLRIGGCLLMPDVIFGNKSVTEDPELMFRMMANGCAALKEVDYYMKLSEKDDAYIFESTTHKLVIRENLFDACMLVSGKKDSQGYLPEGTVLMDTARFLYKLACNKYIGNNDVNDDRKLLRDVFFDNEKYSVTNWKMEHSDSEIATANCYYKVVSEADYKIPIREIENICESDLFNKAYKRLFVSPFDNPQIEVDIKDALKELDDFLHAEPGDEINLSVNGLIQFGQFTKPTYKMIKKHTDGLREHMGEKLDNMDKELPVMIKSIKNKLWNSLDAVIARYIKVCGPYAAIDIIPENDVSFEVQFLGGDTRMQNMILLADDEKVVEVQGSNEGSVETITMIAEENDTVKFTYDSDSGDITMEAKYDEESYNFAGNLAVDKNSMVITIDDLGSASEDVSGSITWKKGAQFEEVSGDTFDLGNATEEEWQDLLHEIFAAMLGGF